MSEKPDMEEILRNFDYPPGNNVKRTVLSSYSRVYSSRGIHRFWKRPIALWQAAAALILIAALSFAAGIRVTTTHEQSLPVSSRVIEQDSTSLYIIKTAAAVNDLL